MSFNVGGGVLTNGSTQRPANNVDLRRLQALIPYLTGPIPSNTPTPVGTFIFLMNQSMASTANTDTTITHNLGRIPNGYIQIRSRGGTVYDASTGTTNWTATTMVLRDTAAGDVVSLIIL